jgi:hypothetical protein
MLRGTTQVPGLLPGTFADNGLPYAALIIALP